MLSIWTDIYLNSWHFQPNRMSCHASSHRVGLEFSHARENIVAAPRTEGKKKEVAHLRRQKADYVRGNAMYKDNERVKKRKRRREKERQQVSLYPSRERSIPTHPTHLRKVIDLAPSLLTRCISILSACLRKLISILADISQIYARTTIPSPRVSLEEDRSKAIWEINRYVALRGQHRQRRAFVSANRISSAWLRRMKFFIEVEMDGERNSAKDMLRRVETVKLRINFYRERVRNISTSYILEYAIVGEAYCSR